MRIQTDRAHHALARALEAHGLADAPASAAPQSAVERLLALDPAVAHKVLTTALALHAGSSAPPIGSTAAEIAALDPSNVGITPAQRRTAMLRTAMTQGLRTVVPPTPPLP